MTQFAFILTSAIVFGLLCYNLCTALENLLGGENQNLRVFLCFTCLGLTIGSFALYENGWHWLMLFYDY